MSPTQRSLAHLRSHGFTVGITEHWNSFVHRRQDLFGFIDLIGVHPDFGVLAVQTTSGSNLAARRTKILAEPRALSWLKAGGKIVIHGWRKIGARGKRKIWELRAENIVTGDFDEVMP